MEQKCDGIPFFFLFCFVFEVKLQQFATNRNCVSHTLFSAHFVYALIAHQPIKPDQFHWVGRYNSIRMRQTNDDAAKKLHFLSQSLINALVCAGRTYNVLIKENIREWLKTDIIFKFRFMFRVQKHFTINSRVFFVQSFIERKLSCGHKIDRLRPPSKVEWSKIVPLHCSNDQKVFSFDDVDTFSIEFLFAPINLFAPVFLRSSPKEHFQFGK